MSELKTKHALDAAALDQLFREAHTHHAWRPDPVDPALLHQIYDLVKLGPTSANTTPARFVFVTTPEGKQRLLPTLSPLNVEKSRTAPVTVIVAWDNEFHQKLPKLFPQAPAKSWFENNAALIQETAFRNSSLQGAYLILAARALGLDCGPMSGFDAKRLNDEFFPDGKWTANFICNLGYGAPEKLFPRNPRLPFDEACVVL